jgi:hypothetical protein
MDQRLLHFPLLSFNPGDRHVDVVESQWASCATVNLNRTFEQGACPVMASTRRLAAILAADVTGYSRLMGADEEGTQDRA